MTETISFSALDTYQRCPRKYKLAYIDKITRMRFESSATSMGSAVHNGISFGLMLYHATDYKMQPDDLYDSLKAFFETWYSTNLDTLNKDDEDYDQKVLDLQELVREAFGVTYRTLIHIDVPNNWRTVELNTEPLIEKRLSVPSGLPEIIFNFQVDWVAVNLKDGQIYLIDWKTRQRLQQTEDESLIISDNFNVQISLYQYALQQLGVDVRYTLTYQITPSTPKMPNYPTKEGRVSRSLIKTDWQTYREAIIANGEHPDDPYYAGVKEWASVTEWWSPLLAHRSQIEIENRWRAMLQWVERVISDEVYPKYESAMCRFCPFNRICLAEDRGFDVGSLIELEYNYKLNYDYQIED